MRRIMLIVSIALFMFGLIGPSSLLADDGEETGTSPQNTATGNNAQDQAGSDSTESDSLLEKLRDALLGLVGANTDDPDDPLLNVHPPDFNPPTPERDDYGWEDQNK